MAIIVILMETSLLLILVQQNLSNFLQLLKKIFFFTRPVDVFPLVP